MFKFRGAVGLIIVLATEVISEGAEGIILESVLEGYAEYYSAELSEKVKRGMTDNALKCQFNVGGSHIGKIRTLLRLRIFSCSILESRCLGWS